MLTIDCCFMPRSGRSLFTRRNTLGFFVNVLLWSLLRLPWAVAARVSSEVVIIRFCISSNALFSSPESFSVLSVRLFSPMASNLRRDDLAIREPIRRMRLSVENPAELVDELGLVPSDVGDDVPDW